MNAHSFGKILGWLMAAMMLTAFALPGNAAAPGKQFSVTYTPATISPSATPQTLTVTFTNQTPVGGISSINSLRLTAPTGWTLSAPTAIAGGTVSGGTVAESGPASVAFVDIPGGGIKAGGQTWMMTVNVTAPGPASCFSAQAFAGNSLNGNQFDLVSSPQFANSVSTITASAGPNGSISPTGAVSVNCGASKTFTIAPNTGYHVANVLVDGGSVGAVDARTRSPTSRPTTLSLRPSRSTPTSSLRRPVPTGHRAVRQPRA